MQSRGEAGVWTICCDTACGATAAAAAAALSLSSDVAKAQAALTVSWSSRRRTLALPATPARSAGLSPLCRHAAIAHPVLVRSRVEGPHVLPVGTPHDARASGTPRTPNFAAPRAAFAVSWGFICALSAVAARRAPPGGGAPWGRAVPAGQARLAVS